MNSSAPSRQPSNAPTIVLLLLVLAALVFVGWWAFWGKGAQAGANAVLPPAPPPTAPQPTQTRPSPPTLSPPDSTSAGGGTVR